MQKYQLLFFSLLAFFQVFLPKTSLASDDITKSNFMISVKQLDPMMTEASQSSMTYIEAVTSLLDKLGNLLLFIMPLIAGVSIIIAGYYYILSSGDSEKSSKAKMIIKWNAIAIVIALFSFAIIKSIAYILSGVI